MSYRNVSVEEMTYEQSLEWVIDQACDAYAKDKISLERLEQDIENLLQGRTPVDSNGYPLYYDPRLLNYVNY